MIVRVRPLVGRYELIEHFIYPKTRTAVAAAVVKKKKN